MIENVCCYPRGSRILLQTTSNKQRLT